MLKKCKECDFYKREISRRPEAYNFNSQLTDIARVDSVIVFPEYIKFNFNYSVFFNRIKSALGTKNVPVVFLTQCTSWVKHNKFLKDIKYCLQDRQKYLDFSNKTIYFFGSEVGEIFNLPKPIRFYKSYKIQESLLGTNITVYAFPSYYLFINDLNSNIEYFKNALVLPQGVDEVSVNYKEATEEDIEKINKLDKVIIDIESNNILNQYDPDFFISHLGIGTFQDDTIFLVKDANLIKKFDPTNKLVIGFNTAWDIVALLVFSKRENLIDHVVLRDVMLLSYLINENRHLSTGNNLKGLAIAEFGLSEYYEPLKDIEDLQKEILSLEKKINTLKTEVAKEKYRVLLNMARDKYQKVFPQLDLYNAKDVFYTKKLYQKYVNIVTQLYSKEFLKYIHDALLFLTKLKMRGISIDMEKAKKLYEEQNNILKQIQIELSKIANINWLSNQEIEKIILKKYDYLRKDFQYTDTRRVSLSDEALQKYKETPNIIQEPELIRIFNLLSEYRKTQKSLSFVEIVLEKTKNNFLHGNYSLVKTVTGRVSSNDPNMQQFPKEIFINVINSRFGDRGSIWEIDYSQAELRMFAMITGEVNILDVIKNSKDLYKAIAAKALNKNESDITDEERTKFKIVALASIYGITPYGLSISLKVSKEEAAKIQKTFFLAFPKFKEYINHISEKVLKDKVLVSTIGRYRRFPELDIIKYSIPNKLKSKIITQAINFDSQATSSDLTLMNAIRIDNKMRELNLQSKIVNIIHDSITFDILNEEKDTVLNIAHDILLTIPDIIKNKVKIEVPLNYKAKQIYPYETA